MSKTRWFIIIGGVSALLAMGATQFLFPLTAVSPAPTTFATTTPENSSVPAVDIKKVTVSSSADTVPGLPSIAKSDRIASWNFKGVYADDPALITKANAEIKRLLSLVGEGSYSDTALYVGIANQYELLGDGSLAYDYLGRAIKADVNATSGLPWHNLGVLMERLGALETARVAYEKSTIIQPEMKFYHYAYFEFLTIRMKDNSVAIEKEFASAIQNLGQDADMLQLYSEWKNS